MATDVTLTERAQERLRIEDVAWLTTIRSDGQPQSSPVWFSWHDGSLWLRSQSGAAKVANLRHQPRVSFHFDSDGQGGDIVTFEGTAQVVDRLPDEVAQAYLAKYERPIREALQTTPEQLMQDYSATIRIDLSRARSW